MGVARRILAGVFVIAFASYASDCLSMTTPEQAMQCCRSMHCPTHGHQGMGCCESMSRLHATFLQPSVQHERFSVHIEIVDAPESSADPRLDSLALTSLRAAMLHLGLALYLPCLSEFRPDSSRFSRLRYISCAGEEVFDCWRKFCLEDCHFVMEFGRDCHSQS